MRQRKVEEREENYNKRMRSSDKMLQYLWHFLFPSANKEQQVCDLFGGFRTKFWRYRWSLC